ncbi:OST-HTH/LOTUS domain-containing protein, partial [Micromonospora endophytica]
PLTTDTTLMTLIRDAVNAASGDDGWAHLGAVGNILTKRRPDFDSRTYGYAKLTDLVAATGLCDVDRRLPGDGKPAIVYIRLHPHTTPEQPVHP